MSTALARDVDAEFASIVRRSLSDRPAVPATLIPEQLIGVWLTHRICAPEHAAWVRERCRYDRRVLPHWHQDDRGAQNAHRGHHEPAPEGAYSQIPAWTSRDHWLEVVVETAIALHPEAFRWQNGQTVQYLNVDTFREYAVVLSGYAGDQKTGRYCKVKPAILASVLGVVARTVKRCNRVAQVLGLLVVVKPGRMLNLDESTGCRRRGSKQRGLSNECALTIPADQRPPAVDHQPLSDAASVDSVTRTTGNSSRSKSDVILGFREGLRPEEKAGAPRRRPEKGVRPRSPGWRASCQVASELASRYDWLAPEGRRRIAAPLQRFVTAEISWTAADLAHVIDAACLGRPVIPALIRTRPVAILAGILRRLDPLTDHPSLDVGPLIPPKPQPCGHTDCDGFGWINLTIERDGRHYPAAKPCPHCPPGVRTGSWTPNPVAASDPDENPF